ncbi:MAG: hypothetical protein J5614_00405 [Paludibacteraceae bacterium]|nr:hypothetical protein [Paludibacteraceae bacterium]
MADTLVIDVVDISVPIMRAINIAIINQPNPVSGFTATYDQLAYLINFPQYLITDSETGEVVNGENIYDYFPDKDPSGGGGGGGSLIEKSITENGLYKAKDDNAKGYSSVDVNVSGGGIYAGSAPASCRGSNMVGPYGYKVIDE